MRTCITTLLLVISIFMSKAQNTVYLNVNGETRSVTLNENSATQTLIDLLKEGSISVTMNDYGGFEKVGELPQSFPTSNSQITTQPGDIMLYQGNQLVIFYGSNSWSYTPIGKIDNATPENVKEFLGNGTIEAIISLDLLTEIGDIRVNADTDCTVYNLSGQIVNAIPLSPGVYIIKGKKVIIR